MARADIQATLDLSKLDGLEVGPVTLIGEPSWHAASNKWRALANLNGALVLVELRISVTGADNG